jgi:hypothetical protein
VEAETPPEGKGPGVQVIVTSEYEPDKLSNRDYDRLKKVPLPCTVVYRGR